MGLLLFKPTDEQKLPMEARLGQGKPRATRPFEVCSLHMAGAAQIQQALPARGRAWSCDRPANKQMLPLMACLGKHCATVQ